MGKMLEVKLRPVGNAVGLILPASVIKEEKLHIGETIGISVFKRKKVNWKKLLGLAKGASAFERDRTEREF
ncbi:MAG TPA: hypothetical protein VI874_00955 [Candidatus Norongarragalinales archaeon]|nr:hypothetical protein [Candidatus Norongarragalinales archaeon]